MSLTFIWGRREGTQIPGQNNKIEKTVQRCVKAIVILQLSEFIESLLEVMMDNGHPREVSITSFSPFLLSPLLFPDNIPD
jgi:hypothetical protein